MASASTFLSQAQAASACGVSPTTIRSARVKGRLKGVEPDGQGGWRIPVESLVEAGLLDRPGGAPALDVHGEVHALRERLAETEQRLREAEHRAQLAEAVATERARSLEHQRTLLLALMCQPKTEDTPPESQESPQTVYVAPEAPTQAGASQKPAEGRTEHWWSRFKVRRG